MKHLLWPQCYETTYQLQEKTKTHKHVEIKWHILNNQQVTEEIKREIKKFLETNDNENKATQNLWDTAKAVLRGKFIAIQSYLKKQEERWRENLTLHLKQLEKEEQKNPKISRRKEIKEMSRNKWKITERNSSKD